MRDGVLEMSASDRDRAAVVRRCVADPTTAQRPSLRLKCLQHLQFVEAAINFLVADEGNVAQRCVTMREADSRVMLAELALQLQRLETPEVVPFTGKAPAISEIRVNYIEQ